MALADPLVAKPPPLRREAGGVLRVGQTRVTLDSVVAAYEDGASAEEIASAFPPLTLAQVHGAISLYLENREPVGSYLRESEEIGEPMRTTVRQHFPVAEIRRRILARRAERPNSESSGRC